MNIKPELICHLDEHIVFFYASLIRIKSIFIFLCLIAKNMMPVKINLPLGAK